ncbi:MAG TPA: DMT family transporter [Candidatus Polarisedimenticolaceae bacterium]|nr:DMT family transporter [Candidatus Polarisedimenticolaceae bacterium]
MTRASDGPWNHPVRARLAILAAAILFSSGGAAIKATSLTGWQVASFRSGVAALAVLLMLPAARRGWGVRPLVVGIGYAATMICFVLANKLTTSANTIFLQSTAPIYLVLIGPLVLREPIRRREVAFMAVLIVGLALFFIGREPVRITAPQPMQGNVIALLSGVFWALTIAGLRFVGRTGGPSGGAAASVVLGNLIACLVAMPFALPVGQIAFRDVAVVGFLGVFQIGLAYVFLTAGITHVGALEASLLLLAEPVLNPLWAWLVHGERPSAWSSAGGIVIVAATVAKSLYDARTAPQGGRASR